ncbi:MAG: hypothetical protein IJR00_08085 [Lachnospiraceae bacterium]|nr:hypothetical protein [Lachnospiraceae bacterium]
MAVNIVRFGNNTIMDISDSTVTPKTLASGVVAYNAAGERIVGTMAQGNLASLFEIAFQDVYHVASEAEAPDIIANELNIDGFAVPIGTSGISWKKPTVTISEIIWDTNVDENYDLVGTGTVQVSFGEAGSISKAVTFKKSGEGKIYGVKGSSASTYIDTGIAADYGYTLHAKGFAETSTTTLIGAFVSNSARTTLRMLPASNAVQQMWPGNTQYSSAQLGGISVTSVFEYWQKANSLRVVQNNIDNTITPSGNTASGSVGANLLLLNEDISTYRGYGTLLFAEVLDSNGDQIAYFAPYKLHSGEVVIINTSGLTAQQVYDIVENGDSAQMASRIFRPSRGTLIEVSQ